MSDNRKRAFEQTLMALKTDFDDQALLRRFVDTGDRIALGQFFYRHWPDLVRYCQRCLGPDGEDAAQAAVLVFASKASQLVAKADAEDSGWLCGQLFGIARNCVRRVRRDASRRRRHLLGFAGDMAKPLANAVPDEFNRVLREELRKLPEKYREPIELYYLGEKSHKEMAKILGISEGTSRQRCHRGLEKLRKRLAARGVVLSLALFISALQTGEGLQATAPKMVWTITEAAVAFAEAPRQVSGTAAAVARAVLRQPLINGIQRVLLATLTAPVLIGGAILLSSHDPKETPPAPPPVIQDATVVEAPAQFRQLAVLAQGLNAFTTAVSDDGSVAALGKYKGQAYWVEVWDIRPETSPRYLDKLTLIALRRTRETGVRALAFDHGRRLVIGSKDGLLVIWNLDRTQEPRSTQWPGHEDGVTSLAFSKNGRYLYSVGGDRTLKTWDVSGEQPTLLASVELDLAASVTRVSSDGSLLAVGSRTCLRVYETNGQNKPGAPLCLRATLPGSFLGLAFSPIDPTLLIASRGLELVALRVGANELTTIRTIAEPGLGLAHREDIESVALSPDGRYVVSGSMDKSAKLWSIETGEHRRTRTIGGEGNIAITFATDGRFLVTGVNETLLFDAVK